MKEDEEQSLFSANILEAEISPRVSLPTFKSYDSQGDPADHYDNFDVLMTLHGASDVVKCLAFVTTLVQGARAWF